MYTTEALFTETGHWMILSLSANTPPGPGWMC